MYSFLKTPLRKNSPFKSMRWEEFTTLSKMASAIVPSPMISNQADTEIWEDRMVDDCCTDH